MKLIASKLSTLLLTLLLLMVTGHALAQAIVTQSTADSTSRSTSDSTTNSTTKVISPPPTAIAPSITSINNDLCTVGVSGAVQTQIIGFSGGTTTRDMNCERIKLAKNLYDMGMKVAAVSTLCQDERVFRAMMDAGTPCPIDGKIGEAAKEAWEKEPSRQPGSDKNDKKSASGFSALFSSIFN